MSGNAARVLNKKKYHYTYMITDTVNKMFYVGVRSCDCDPEEDPYMSSSKYVKEAIEKHGKDIFVKMVIDVFKTREEANEAEERFLTANNAKANPVFYNKANNHKDLYFNFHDLPKEEQEIMMNRLLAKASTPEAREKSRQGVIKAWRERHNDLVRRIHHKNRDYSKAVISLEKGRGQGKTKLRGNGRTDRQKEASKKRKERIANGWNKWHSEEADRKRSKTMTGRKRPEHSESLKGRIPVVKDGVQRNIKPELLNTFLAEGWVKGTLPKAKWKFKELVCPYCGKVGRGGNMTRYHFNNCKHKEMEITNG